MTEIVRGAYSGNLLLREASGRNVRKFYARRDHHRAERAALRMLSSSDLPIPELLGEGFEGGCPYLDLSRLPGETPSRPLYADGPAIALCQTFGALVRRLHDVTRGWPTPDGIPRRTVRGVLELLPGLPPSVDRDALSRYLETRCDEVDGDGRTRCLLHRDLRFENLLWDESAGHLSLLDFEVCAMGQAEGDLSRVLLFELEPPLHAPFLEGYGFEDRGLEQLKVFHVVFAIEMIAYLGSRASLRPGEHELVLKLLLLLEV